MLRSLFQIRSTQESDSTLSDAGEPRADRQSSEGAAIKIPTRVGRFEISGLLGSGGMGIVLAGHDPQLNRVVAIKLVASRPSSDERTQRLQLLREARAMASLRHPNVVTVFEAGQHEGSVYLAMERREGGTLRDRIEQLDSLGTRNWRDVVDLFGQAGRGLEAAHAAGLVHRDFKTENVLLDRHGCAAVADFGLALVSEGHHDDSAWDSAAHWPEIAGTPAYMAPEQWTGESIDARSDQFSFCAALYEALYGALPFISSEGEHYRSAVLAGRLRPAPAGTRAPTWVYEVLKRGLSKAPEQRFESMGELLAELGVSNTQQLTAGRVARATVITAVGVFVVAWAIAALGFSIEPSYMFHYSTDITLFLLTGTLGILARAHLARSTYNQQVYFLTLLSSVAIVLLTLGGHLMGTPADRLVAYHLVMIATAFLGAAVGIDRRFAVVSALYFVGFLVASYRVDIGLVVCLPVHTIAIAISVNLVWGQEATSESPLLVAADAPAEHRVRNSTVATVKRHQSPPSDAAPGEAPASDAPPSDASQDRVTWV